MYYKVLEKAINSVQKAERAFCKFLTANDAGATGSHQVGILVSKSAKEMLFSCNIDNESIVKRSVEILWQDDVMTESMFTYYRSKNEFRITRFGRNFPFINPELTGSLFVLVQKTEDRYDAFILESEDEIEDFLGAFNIAVTETNCLIKNKNYLGQKECLEINRFIDNLKEDFPTSFEMSKAARDIHDIVYNHKEYMVTNPDRKLIEWNAMEYSLFRAIEHSRYYSVISKGFVSVDEFVEFSNMVLNRRKSRAGKSLENHLSALFDANNIKYSSQAVTEGRKKPDFIFPSVDDYHSSHFPVEKIITLAAKTTCKDRWRQIINEADRLRNRPKYLCTLQQGISPSQLDEMNSENVILVVPKPYISSYPADKRDKIWTLYDFIKYVKSTESEI